MPTRQEIMEAHAVLEWDYNVDGWLRERPSNRRRREATSIQLSRMKFAARRDLGFDTLSDDGKRVYLANVVRWKLPIDDEQLRFVRRLFSQAWMGTHCPAALTPRFDHWYLDHMTQHYLIAALWTDVDDDETPLDANYGVGNVAQPSMAAARSDCQQFVAVAGADLAAWSPEQAGHDFWLTRNHHGAGFWDRGKGTAGERLTALAQTYRERNAFVGDDGCVHVQ